MSPAGHVNDHRLGVICVAATAVLSLAYALTLFAGLLSWTFLEHPIGEPYFPILELLVFLIAPVMVPVMVAVHAWAPPEAK